MHDHPSPSEELCLPDLPCKCFINVFRECCHLLWWSFAAFFEGFRSLTNARPATLGRTLSLYGATTNSIIAPYVCSMLLLYIRMLGLHVAFARGFCLVHFRPKVSASIEGIP